MIKPHHGKLTDYISPFQIPLVSDLPVGDNMEDHVILFPFDFEVPEPISITPARVESFYESTIYDLNGGGMAPSSNKRFANPYQFQQGQDHPISIYMIQEQCF